MEINHSLRVKFQKIHLHYLFIVEADFNGISINFTNGNNHYYINEGQANIMSDALNNPIKSIRPLMVTQTTSDITKELLLSQKCNLPNYINIQETHELFLKSLNQHFQVQKNTSLANHLMESKLLLVGAGNMAIDYVHVLNHLEKSFDTVCRTQKCI